MATQTTLPRDAEGKEIPLDTEVLYDEKGNERKVYNYMFYPKSLAWIVNIETKDKPIYYAPTSLRLTPPDSWDKLLDDLDNATKGGDNAECLYSRRESVEVGSQCYGCKLYNSNCGSDECEYLAYGNIADRIRNLRGEN